MLTLKNIISRGYFWPTLVITFLLMQIGICAAAIISATSSDSYILVSKEQSWDSQQAMKQKLQDSGWIVHFDIPVHSDTQGQRRITLTLQAINKAPITGVKVNLMIYHHAQARNIYKSPLIETKPGIYSANFPITSGGLWELQYTFNSHGTEYKGHHTYSVADFKIKDSLQQ